MKGMKWMNFTLGVERLSETNAHDEPEIEFKDNYMIKESFLFCNTGFHFFPESGRGSVKNS